MITEQEHGPLKPGFCLVGMSAAAGAPAFRNICPSAFVNYGRGLVMFTFLLWCILFVMCWPLAILALILYPFLWLLLLPFRLVGIAVHGVLALVWAVVMLPARLLSAPFRLA